jgi:hypothetical protein
MLQRRLVRVIAVAVRCRLLFFFLVRSVAVNLPALAAAYSSLLMRIVPDGPG